jgi:hypothetical protein
MNYLLSTLMSWRLSSSSLRAKRSNLKSSERLLRFARNDGVVISGRRLIFMVVIVFAFSVTFAQAAEPEKKDDRLFHMKTMQGEVMGKTRTNLSVEFNRDGNNTFEAVLPIDDKVKFVGYRSYNEVKLFDSIRSELKEFYEVDKDGKERVTGKVATKIELIRGNTHGSFFSKEKK